MSFLSSEHSAGERGRRFDQGSSEGFWAGNEWVVGNEIAQGVIRGFADTNAAGNFYGWSRKTIFGEPEAGMRGGEVASVVAEAGDAECLGEASGAAGETNQIARGVDFEISLAGHLFDAVKRFEGAEEDAASFAIGLAGDI